MSATFQHSFKSFSANLDASSLLDGNPPSESARYSRASRVLFIGRHAEGVDMNCYDDIEPVCLSMAVTTVDSLSVAWIASTALLIAWIFCIFLSAFCLDDVSDSYWPDSAICSTTVAGPQSASIPQTRCAGAPGRISPDSSRPVFLGP